MNSQVVDRSDEGVGGRGVVNHALSSGGGANDFAVDLALVQLGHGLAK